MSSSVNRRAFLAGTAAAGAAMSLPAASYARVQGANDKLRVAFLGVGGRCQQHIDVILEMQKEGKAVEPVAVCDVWDGQARSGRHQGPRPVSLRRDGAASNEDDKDARHQGLPQDPRAEGRRRRRASPRRPLARQDGHRRHGRRQGRLLRKADDQDDRRGDRGRRCRAEDEQGRDGRRAVDGRPDLAGGERVHRGRQDRPRAAGPDQLLPQLAASASGATTR